MTGEAQCEERKRTLGLAPHPHSFHPPQARVEVMSSCPGETKGDVTHCFNLTSTQSTSSLTQNYITVLISWCGSNKKKEALGKDFTVPVRLTLDWYKVRAEQETAALAPAFVRTKSGHVCNSGPISISQEKWSIITSSKLPLFPFQHHTELRYQLTHYPLSPGDW